MRFVIIGGVAARLLGSPTITRDLDLCYALDEANLERLASALQELGADLRGTPPGLPFRLDARTLAKGDAFTFTTDLGPLDLLAIPGGTTGFEQLEANALTFELDGLTVRSASIDDLMLMKRAAGRAKDRIELEILSAIADSDGAAG